MSELEASKNVLNEIDAKGYVTVKKTTKQKIRTRKRRQRTRSYLIGGGIGIALLVLIISLVRPAVTRAAGETIPLMPSSKHITPGTDPGPYNSDPPTSGQHYPEGLDAGFYEQNDIEEYEPYPEGHLIHNLEHGYVIFWYNCDVISEEECTLLKAEIKVVMDDANNFKVIAFPWKSIEEPVVMTSWTRLERMESFDTDRAVDFISRNRNRAPEPQAP